MKRRNTVAKEEILNILKTSNEAFSQDSIQKRITVSADRATVYRILNRVKLKLNYIIMKVVFLSALFATVLLTSCSSDDDSTPQVEIPEELITNVDVSLVSGDETVTLSFVDADGFGFGEAASVIAESTLEANTTYTGSFSILNELADEEEERNVGAEILELHNEHQFFFTPEMGSGLDITTTYEDVDDNEYPVGLDFTLTTGDASTGELRITLRHEPNKSAEGVSDGDIDAETDGESDFDIFFPITIEDSTVAETE